MIVVGGESLQTTVGNPVIVEQAELSADASVEDEQFTIRGSFTPFNLVRIMFVDAAQLSCTYTLPIVLPEQ